MTTFFSDQTYPGYSMYTGIPTHIAHMKQNATSTAFFMRDEIKLDLLSRQAAVHSEVEGAPAGMSTFHYNWT